jgi:uncharacterized protein (UPF0212 family)
MVSSVSMALIPCPECGSKVSSEAFACPKCGKPIKAAWMVRSPKRMLMLWALLIVMFLAIWQFLGMRGGR